MVSGGFFLLGGGGMSTLDFGLDIVDRVGRLDL